MAISRDFSQSYGVSAAAAGQGAVGVVVVVVVAVVHPELARQEIDNILVPPACQRRPGDGPSCDQHFRNLGRTKKHREGIAGIPYGLWHRHARNNESRGSAAGVSSRCDTARDSSRRMNCIV